MDDVETGVLELLSPSPLLPLTVDPVVALVMADTPRPLFPTSLVADADVAVFFPLVISLPCLVLPLDKVSAGVGKENEVQEVGLYTVHSAPRLRPPSREFLHVVREETSGLVLHTPLGAGSTAGVGVC